MSQASVEAHQKQDNTVRVVASVAAVAAFLSLAVFAAVAGIKIYKKYNRARNQRVAEFGLTFNPVYRETTTKL